MKIDCDWPLWPRQKQCLESVGNDQLFGGASEGGKSYLARIALCCAGMQCEGLKMTLIRKKSSDIAENHLDGDRGLRNLLYPLSSQGVVDVTEKHIRFPKNNILNFKHCQDERQFDSAQGNENQIVVIDEAPQIKERLIRAFRGWCRMTPEHLARQPLFWQKKLPWILQTGNPTGESVGYYRRHYVQARPQFSIGEVGGFRRQYILSRAEDNRSVNLDQHKQRLSEIGNAELARALDLGDWDAIQGDFYKEYNDDLHSIDDHPFPAHWFKYRTFDWGSADPFAAYWIAVSDGEEYKDPTAGTRKWYPRGALIVYREWYGCNAEDPSKGVHMRNESIAAGILERTRETTCGLTFTDNWPFADRGGSKDGERYTMADTFRDAGCPLTLGNTARVYGWKQLRSRLQGISGVPMIYIFKSCKYLRDYIPVLMYHETKPEDAQESGEPTHACDAIRLACTVKPLITNEPIIETGFDISKENLTYDAVVERIQRQQNRGNSYY